MGRRGSMARRIVAEARSEDNGATSGGDGARGRSPSGLRRVARRILAGRAHATSSPSRRAPCARFARRTSRSEPNEAGFGRIGMPGIVACARGTRNATLRESQAPGLDLSSRRRGLRSSWEQSRARCRSTPPERTLHRHPACMPRARRRGERGSRREAARAWSSCRPIRYRAPRRFSPERR